MDLKGRIQSYLDAEGVLELPTSAIYKNVATLWGNGKDHEVESLLHSQYADQFFSGGFYEYVAQSLDGTPLYDVLAGRARKGVAWNIRNVAREMNSTTKSFLDTGCGTALMTCFLAKDYPTIQFTAIDSSEEMLTVAKQRTQKYALNNLVCIHASIEEYEPAQRYDCILCAHVLYEGASQGWEESVAVNRSAMLNNLIASQGKVIIIENEAPMQGGHTQEKETQSASGKMFERVYKYNDADTVGMTHSLKVFF